MQDILGLSMLHLLQGPVSCIWHGSKVCALFEREGTNWVASSAGALWAVGRIQGASRLVREKREYC